MATAGQGLDMKHIHSYIPTVCIPEHVYVCMHLLQIPIFRPPNYTLMMVWMVAVVIGLVFAYWKRENLTTLFDPTKWAFLAMVSVDCTTHSTQ